MKLGHRALFALSKPEKMSGINTKEMDAEYLFFTGKEIQDPEYQAVQAYCREANLGKGITLYVTHIEKIYTDESLDHELKIRGKNLKKGIDGIIRTGTAAKDGIEIGIFQYQSGEELDHTVNRGIKETLRAIME